MFIDYGVSCASWEYRAGAGAAWATLALFGVAVPVFLLFKARSAALHPIVSGYVLCPTSSGPDQAINSNQPCVGPFHPEPAST